jgi:hypothetical protein
MFNVVKAGKDQPQNAAWFHGACSFCDAEIECQRKDTIGAKGLAINCPCCYSSHIALLPGRHPQAS